MDTGFLGLEALGPGPVKVVQVVAKSEYDLPRGVVLETRLDLTEINEVWLI